jgi:hypothetical protein
LTSSIVCCSTTNAVSRTNRIARILRTLQYFWKVYWSETLFSRSSDQNFSAMNSAVEFDVSPSGRPILLSGEVELRMESNVSLYDGESKVQSLGSMTLSTHRILYQLDGYRAAFPLEAITDIQENCPWVGKSKLILYFAPAKFIMFTFATGFKAIRKAVMDAVDSRKRALVTNPASLSAATARPQISTGIGTVLEMKVGSWPRLSRLLHRHSTRP